MVEIHTKTSKILYHKEIKLEYFSSFSFFSVPVNIHKLELLTVFEHRAEKLFEISKCSKYRGSNQL